MNIYSLFGQRPAIEPLRARARQGWTSISPVDGRWPPWHSARMHRPFSARRLFVILLLSQALAVQALVAALSGALLPASDSAGDLLAAICRPSMLALADGDVAPQPAQPGKHHNCAAACLSASSGAQASPAPEAGFFAPVRSCAAASYLSGLSSPAIVSSRAAFAARGPPSIV